MTDNQNQPTQGTPAPSQPTHYEEVILDELDVEANPQVIHTASSIKFPVGSKVKIVNYPPPVDPKNGFNWNGLIGIVKSHFSDPSGLVFYDIFIENVQVPFSRLNPVTNKLQRGYIKTSAQNRFDDTFLERA